MGNQGDAAICPPELREQASTAWHARIGIEIEAWGYCYGLQLAMRCSLQCNIPAKIVTGKEKLCYCHQDGQFVKSIHEVSMSNAIGVCFYDETVGRSIIAKVGILLEDHMFAHG